MTPFAIPGLMGAQPVKHLDQVAPSPDGSIELVVFSQDEDATEPDLEVTGLTLEDTVWLTQEQGQEALHASVADGVKTWTLRLHAEVHDVPFGLSKLVVWRKVANVKQVWFLDYRGTLFTVTGVFYLRGGILYNSDGSEAV